MDTTIIPRFENFDEESLRIQNQLNDVLKNKAIPGISAPELGINFPIIAVKNTANNPWVIAFNPRIVYASGEMLNVYETCYSYPGIMVKISRPQSIRVRYQDATGETLTSQLEGAVARLFQHEMTHLAIPPRSFWMDATYIHKNKAIKDWKTMSRKLRRD